MTQNKMVMFMVMDSCWVCKLSRAVYLICTMQQGLKSIYWWIHHARLGLIWLLSGQIVSRSGIQNARLGQIRLLSGQIVSRSGIQSARLGQIRLLSGQVVSRSGIQIARLGQIKQGACNQVLLPSNFVQYLVPTLPSHYQIWPTLAILTLMIPQTARSGTNTFGDALQYSLICTTGLLQSSLVKLRGSGCETINYQRLLGQA